MKFIKRFRVLFMAIICLILVGLFAEDKLHFSHVVASSYHLEVGYDEKDTGGIENPNTRFINNKQLLVLARTEYHKTIPGTTSELTITQKTSGTVLQTEKWTESKEATGVPIKLKNLEWSNGEYRIKWEREGKTLSTIDIVLTSE